jgi:acetyl-CoA decarbonylase/synthase complex subunit delta
MLEQYIENWHNSINTVEIGNSSSKTIKIGGENSLPFLYKEGSLSNRTIIAHEIWDITPIDWPELLTKELNKVYTDPVKWALYCKEELGAEVICLRLQGAHSDTKNRSADESAKICKKVQDATKLPLIILGCGEHSKDNEILPICSQALKGNNCLFGSATQEDYKTLVAACIADNHNIIAESPIDINIAKQLNILISDTGLAANRIVMNPTVGALGYGLEYTYSIMERARLAALTGDKMLSMPFICFVGQEAWRTKEAKATLKDFPDWGKEELRGPLWEMITASAFLQSGADILVMRHPKSILETKKLIDKLT